VKQTKIVAVAVINTVCVISGFSRSVNEIFALLDCHAAQIGSYRRFGTTFQSRCLTLEDVPGKLSRKVSNYQSTLCNITEERRSQ